MIHLIILTIAIILVILSAVAISIASFDKEDKFPRWMSWNWPFIFIMFAMIVGIGYFAYLVYPHIFTFLQHLKGATS